MSQGYEAFCLNDPLFYDAPMLARDDDVDYELANRSVPPGWRRDSLEDWLVYTPADADVPSQGWKIHASASLDDAEKILNVVWDYCLEQRIPFKFVRSAQLLLLANGKYADRASSGKFITIYPRDEVQFGEALNDLGVALAGFQGPYILSDLRWSDGPLYVRYGAFAERYCLSDSGEVVPAIEAPDGLLVPDRRGTAFSVPPWVTVPTLLAPALEARAATTLANLPYRVERPLHFSNGGGVYLATDARTDEPVILKEARPHAGLAIDGSDAVQRLANERVILESLAGLGAVPEVKGAFIVGGHHFLALEYIEGTPLSGSLVDRYPLSLLGESKDFTGYTSWAVEVMTKLRRLVAAVHERGVVIGDLHPGNVLIRADGRLVLVDLEVASDVRSARRPTLVDPAFAAPDDRAGFEVDEYALAAIGLSVFLPLTELIALDTSKVDQFAREIQALFPLPTGYLENAVEVLHRHTGARFPAMDDGATDKLHRIRAPRRPTDDRPEQTSLRDLLSEGDLVHVWPQLRDGLARAIVHSATPERDDRLFPGDVAQFEHGGLNLANGAAGVLLALSETGVDPDPTHIDWLVRRATHPLPGTRFGFYDGLHGVAYALDRLGRPTEARDVLALSLRELGQSVWDVGNDLQGGLAGIGLNLTHFAHRDDDDTLWARAAEIGEELAERLGDVDDVGTLSGGKAPYAGLLRGSTGSALFFLELHRKYGNSQLLDLAEIAIRQDLRRCVLREDGALEVDEGYRTMPYLLDGSVGIGMVLDRFLQLRPDADLAAASGQIRTAAEAEFYIESGLFSGRAGMVLALAARRTDRSPDEVAVAQVRRLRWHAVGYGGGLAFPGSQLLRLSMDLATGTAGVLLAIGAALADDPIALPFLAPRLEDRAPRVQQRG